jgi:hypothetical protein
MIVTDTYFPYVPLLLKTTATNTQNNSTFLDSSTNNFNITRVGTPTQGSFSPYRDVGYWSNYFVISSALSGVPTNMSFGLSTNFTIEAFINWPAAAAGNQTFFELTGGARMILGRTTTGTRIFWHGTERGTTYTFTPGTWYHFAIVRNSGTVYCYINGVSAITPFAETITWSSIGRFNIAMNSDTAEPMTGYISNLRVVNGTAVYTGAFTPPTTPLTAITNTSLLTCQSNRFKDNSTSNYTLTVQVGTPRVQTFQPFNLPTAYSTATYGGSVYFNGNPDYLAISAPNGGALDVSGGSNFTIEAWFYATSTASTTIWSRGGTNGSQNAQYWAFLNNGSIQWAIGNGGTGAALNTVTGVQYNCWNHFAVVLVGTTFTAYLNGTAINTATLTFTIPTTISNPTLWIGGQADPGARLWFSGYITGFRLVKGTAVYTSNFTPSTAPLTAITNTSILANFSNAGIYDASGQNNLTTLGSAQVSTTTAKWNTTSMKFNGTTDYLNLVSSPGFSFGTGSFTIEAWVYNTSSSAVAKNIFGHWSVSPESYQFYLSTVNRLTWQIYNQSSTNSASLDVPLNTWTHVSWSKSGTTSYLHINGVLQNTVTGVTNSANGGEVPRVGAGQSAGQLFPGYIQDLRITKGIARYGASNFSVPTAEFPVR